ncbi:TRAP transporter small permease [Marinibaculum pumilum]|uniref:TRAP transporter small permease protein n=1 Tax=Marinibaculum pumilum TaxID=1766165 RepID=A0ABV7KWM1_9PROT
MSLLHRWVRGLLGIVLLAMVLLNVANAAGRYLFAASITGADEILVFAMIFLVILGAVLALALRSHIALELLPSHLKGRSASALFVLHDLATLCIAGFAADASWQFVQRIAAINPRSMALGLPMAIPHAALLAGLAGLAALALFLLVRDLRALLRAGAEAADGGGGA